MSEKIACNVCRSSDACLVKQGVYGNPEQSIYECQACRHVFLAPLLDDADEARFYHDQYSAFLVSRGDSKSASPEQHFAGNKAEAERRFKDVQAYLTKGSSVLEIGSATGFFLSRIKDSVAEVVGIEQNAEQREYASRIGIPTYASFEAVAGKSFDIVFLYYLLEHIKHPVDFAKQLKKLLRGVSSRLVIEVPNVNEALVSLYKSTAYNEFVWQRAHCSYFSTQVLEAIFAGLGFRTEFIPLQRYDLSNHIHWLAVGKPGGTGKYSHVFSEALDRQYRNDLKERWLCDSILLIAELTRKD